MGCITSNTITDKQLLCRTYNTTPLMTYNFTKAKVLKVYDGDTITIAAFHINQIYRFNVRIFGIDCDEIRGGNYTTKRNAKLAKKYVSNLILDKIVDCNILNNKLYNGSMVKEKFGRLLANITIDGKDLGELLINANLARRYNGKCKENTPLYPKIDQLPESHI